jgi:hypothetical protein
MHLFLQLQSYYLAWGFELPDCPVVLFGKSSCGNAQLEAIIGERSGNLLSSFNNII